MSGQVPPLKLSYPTEQVAVPRCLLRKNPGSSQLPGCAQHSSELWIVWPKPAGSHAGD